MTEKNSSGHIAPVHTGPSVLVVDDEHDFMETLVKHLNVVVLMSRVLTVV